PYVRRDRLSHVFDADPAWHAVAVEEPARRSDLDGRDGFLLIVRDEPVDQRHFGPVPQQLADRDRARVDHERAITTAALLPPHPNELDANTSRSQCRPSPSKSISSRSGSRSPSHACRGKRCSRFASPSSSQQTPTSSAPAAPSVCPSSDFVDEHGT